MQVIGLGPAIEVSNQIARRSSRRQVEDWAARVVLRHIKRTAELLMPFKNVAEIKKAARKDQLSAEVIERIVDAYRAGEVVYYPSRESMKTLLDRGLDTMDFIESLPSSDRRIRRIERMSWIDAENMAAAWHVSLEKVRVQAGDLMDGVHKVYEFPDGSFMGELTTQKSLVAEGDAMGHCVGGYFTRVNSGGIRIISLRDKTGNPHVTIELTRMSTVYVDGLGEMKLLSSLVAGRNEVLNTDIDWYAIQIKGKQNRRPADRYRILVDQWLREASIPVSSDKLSSVNGLTTTLYSVYNPETRQSFNTIDPDRAFTVACEYIFGLTDISLEKRIAERTGIFSILPDVKDVELVNSFMDRFVDLVIRNCKVRPGEDTLVKVSNTGIWKLVKQVKEHFPGARQDWEAKVVDQMLEREESDVVREKTVPIFEADGDISLYARVHEIPTVGLGLLLTNMGNGREERILSALGKNLRTVLQNMQREKTNYHVLSPAQRRVKALDLERAFIICGLSGEFEAAKAENKAEIKVKIRDLKLASRHARLKGRDVNLALNMLSEGYEDRILKVVREKCKGSVIVVGPEATKHTAAPTLQSAPIMKTYNLPNR